MVFKFVVSAPGKVILHGEHSVVYGKPAIAGVVQVRNELKLQETPQETNISVRFSKLGLNFEINNEALNTFVSSLRSKYESLDLPKDLNHETFFAEAKEFVSGQFKSTSEREINSVVSFVYLLVGIKLAKKIHNTPAFEVDLETGMSIGAGLGSSASFGVCLAGAFVVLTSLHKTPDFLDTFHNGDEANKSSVLQEISDWAFCSEKIMHGNPSGLDNTICTFGNVVKFYRGQVPEFIPLQCPIPVLLVDTQVSRSTATLVQKVKDLMEKHPEVVQSIFDSMGHVVEDATEILKTITEDDVVKFQDLQNLVGINNNLLRALGVSHPKLERIFVIAEEHGFQAKLSGAGGGGFAMILPGATGQWDETSYSRMLDSLKANGFELTETKLGGEGFQVQTL